MDNKTADIVYEL